MCKIYDRATSVLLLMKKKIAFPHQPLHTDFPSELKTEMRLVDKQRWDLSGCQGIIFHFIISSAVGSVDVSVDRLRYITRACCHHTQGRMCYPLQGRVAWMVGTSGAEADLGPGRMLSLTDTCGHSWWLRAVWLLPTSQVSVWLRECEEAPLTASH